MTSSNFNRRSIRLPDYDYSWAGEYFITICTYERQCILGDIAEGKMILNELGKCAAKFWEELPLHYNRLSLGEWVVMPNHIHGILIINDEIPVGVIHESPLNESPLIESPLKDSSLHNPLLYKRRKMLLSKIIGRFKMTSAKEINLLCSTPASPVWQKNYYEHIVRDSKSYTEIENYICLNPLKWEEDRDNPAVLIR